MTVPQKYRDVVKVLGANGWTYLRTKGPHEVSMTPDGQRFTLPRHAEDSAGVLGKLLQLVEDKPGSWR